MDSLDNSTGESSRIQALLKDGKECKQFTAAVAVIGGSDGIFASEAIGTTDPGNDKQQSVDLGTIFDVASLTKPIVMTTIFFQLLEHGRLTMTDTVGEHVSALSRKRLGDIPLQTLLTHTSGLKPYVYSPEWSNRGEALADLYRRPLIDRQIDSSFKYSCLNYILLADVLRLATDKDLATLANKHVFEPSGMDCVSLRPVDPERIDAQVAPTYDHAYRHQTLRGEIHDPISNVMDGESGNAGLFASTRAVARFAQTVLEDQHGARRLLAPSTVTSLPVRRSGTDTVSQGYGWRVATDTIPAPTWSDRAIGHTGYTGTSLWLDLKHDWFACLLTNAVYERAQLYRFRQRFHQIVAAERF